MSLMIEIPDEAVRALRLPACEVQAVLKKELALLLYCRGALSIGKATEIAGITRQEFEKVLADRKIARPYSDEALAEDLKFAREFSKSR